MAQYKRSREDNWDDENLPLKRSCSRSNSTSLREASVLVFLADFLFADDENDINGHELETAGQDGLVLDMMRSLSQEINSCNKNNSTGFASDGTEGYMICSNHNSADHNPRSSFIVGESLNSSCKMDDGTYSVNIEYLLHATDEELGIPPTSFSDLKTTDQNSTFHSHHKSHQNA